MVMATNKVQESRRAEGFSRAAFARRANISDQTLKSVEEGVNNVMQHTKDRIVNAFNELSHKKREYTHAYLFPDG
jgi:DNA-binding XRE family transcriptional regulator